MHAVVAKNGGRRGGARQTGRREAASDGPFAVTVWGLGYCASYGYAGGMGSRPITKVEVPVR